ncbi:MAG: Hint domain-containing protein [Candidatus Parabeggiatoa sp.]|nr:Hint domain-containing protein [Candidatus Parabeggiatoa sp.]
MNKRHVNCLTPLIVAVVALFSLNPVLAEFRDLPDNKVEIKYPTGYIQVLPWCKDIGHCNSVNAMVNAQCNAQGYSHRHPLPVVDPAKTAMCACPCGCVTGDVRIMLSNREFKRADTLVEGDLIMVMTSSGLQSASIYLVTRSSITHHNVQKVTLSDGSTLTASNNHTVVNEYDQLIALDSVAIGSQLRRYDGELVEVLTNEKVTKESIDLINVMINIESTVPLHHVYVTNNLLSGDMLVQLTSDASEAAGKGINLIWDEIDLSNVPHKK